MSSEYTCGNKQDCLKEHTNKSLLTETADIQDAIYRSQHTVCLYCVTRPLYL